MKIYLRIQAVIKCNNALYKKSYYEYNHYKCKLLIVNIDNLFKASIELNDFNFMQI